MVTDFKQIIVDSFSDIIDDFKFHVSTDHNKIFEEVQLVNEKCIVRFMYDMGNVLCDFIDSVEKSLREEVVRKDGFPSGFPVYPLFSVWKFLYPNDKESFNYNGSNITEQALAIKSLILGRFRNIIKGDFSWTAAYKENYHPG